MSTQYVLPPLSVRWRLVGSNVWQYEAQGGKLMCPAVLGACGPSEKPSQAGTFWWNTRTTPNLPKSDTSYAATIDDAKQATEDYLAAEIEALKL